MRIVFVNSSRIWGGNEKWTCEAASGLAARGHDVLLVGQSDLMADRASSFGIDFRHLRLRGDGDLLGIVRLSRIFRRFRPGAVILTKSKEYWLGGIAAKLAGVERICFRLGIDRPVQRNTKYRLLFGNICDTFIVNAESVKRILLDAPFIGEDKIAIVKNGVSLDGTRAAAASSNETVSTEDNGVSPNGVSGARSAQSPACGPESGAGIGMPPGPRVIGATGRLAKQKGFDILIRAFGAVRDRFPDAYLVIAGEGHERKSLTELIGRLGLSDSVSLPGFVNDIDAFYRSLTIFALPSRFEGMPNALLEAMAAGVPVVASQVSGVAELLVDGETGRLVQAEDVEGLAATIVDLLGDERQRSHMAERARRLVATECGMDRMLDELEGVLAGRGENAG